MDWVGYFSINAEYVFMLYSVKIVLFLLLNCWFHSFGVRSRRPVECDTFISLSARFLPDVALEREVEGDLLLADMGQVCVS